MKKDVKTYQITTRDIIFNYANILTDEVRVRLIYYTHVNHSNCDASIIEKCAQLFSYHYGTWPNGNRVTLTPKRLRELVWFDPSCELVFAESRNKIVGYCFYCKFKVANESCV